jgi:DNA uptake protein ComE-like DNA-binding protein
VFIPPRLETNPDTATFSGCFFGSSQITVSRRPFKEVTMQLKPLFTVLTALAMLFAADLSLAYEHESERPAQTPGKTEGATPTRAASKAAIDAKAKAAVKIKRVDINSASKAALKKLPGITDVEAEKIIAGRPYGSKAWLVTNKVLPAETYGTIKSRIEARQPYKSAEKNAALYQKQVRSQ